MTALDGGPYANGEGEWQEPEPFGVGDEPGAALDAKLFGALAPVAEEIAERTGAPWEFSQLGVLGAVGLAAAPGIEVENWYGRMPASTYMVLGLESCASKSVTLKAMTCDLLADDNAAYLRWLDEAEGADKGSDPRLMRSNATIQRVLKDLWTISANKADREAKRYPALAIFDSEPTFLTGFSWSGGQARHTQTYLNKLWGSEPVDRSVARGDGQSSAASDYIHSARLGMLIATQPDVVIDLLKDTRVTKSGFAGRLIVAECKGRLVPSGESVTGPNAVAYRERLAAISRTVAVMRHTAAANAASRDWDAKFHARLNERPDHERPVRGRTIEIGTRVAALMAAFEGGDMVDDHVLSRGVEIAMWAEHERVRLVRRAQRITPHGNAVAIVEWMRRACATGAAGLTGEVGETPEFHHRELLRKGPSQLRKAEVLDNALMAAEERCWVREVKRGRSRLIQLNPAWREFEPVLELDFEA